jgi:hypothetical protein
MCTLVCDEIFSANLSTSLSQADELTLLLAPVDRGETGRLVNKREGCGKDGFGDFTVGDVVDSVSKLCRN